MKEEDRKHIVFRKGKKSILRPLCEGDIPSLLVWMNDPSVTHYLRRCDPLSETEERAWFTNLSNRQNDRILAIETHEHEFIGTMGLYKIEWENGTAITGACIGKKEYWGKGYGSDAKMLVLDYAFNTLNLRKVCATVLAFNERSYHYQKKCGYKEEGRQKEQVFADGAYHDLIFLAVFREDWLPLWKEYKFGT